MDKLEIVIEMVRRAQNDRKRLEAMNKELEKVGPRWVDKCEIYRKYTPTPCKAVINNSLKMARQLIKDEYI